MSSLLPDERRAAGAGKARPADPSRRLATRAVSAAVLAALALGANFAGAMPFAILVSALALVMAWEWTRVVRGETANMAFALFAGALVMGTGLAAFGMAALGAAALAIGTVLVAVSTLGSGSQLSAPGVLYVGLPAVALIWLRASEPYGASAILLIFLLVWTYDTAAFAAGSLIGGPKLMPRVSPKKTWAGLLGGVVASAAMGAFFAVFLLGSPPWWLATSGALLGVVAQAGDLVESGVKRGSGVKDASALIPGHGGFMDRLDSTQAVAVVAGIAALAIDPASPARAVLFGG